MLIDYTTSGQKNPEINKLKNLPDPEIKQIYHIILVIRLYLHHLNYVGEETKKCKNYITKTHADKTQTPHGAQQPLAVNLAFPAVLRTADQPRCNEQHEENEIETEFGLECIIKQGGDGKQHEKCGYIHGQLQRLLSIFISLQDNEIHQYKRNERKKT